MLMILGQGGTIIGWRDIVCTFGVDCTHMEISNFYPMSYDLSIGMDTL